MEAKNRLIRFVLARVVVVSLFLLSTTILGIRGPETSPKYILPDITQLVVATYLVSLFALVILKKTSKFNRALSYLQIVWDLGFVTLLLLLTGGIGSPYSFLYLLSIISASILLSRKEALYTAGLCSILYGALMDLHYYGRLTSLGLSSVAAQQFQPGAFFFIISVTIFGFFLTAFLTGYLADKLRASETALLKQTIDFEEMERLNSSIVSNLNSGLLTITNDGRIRAFNRYAEQLTGVSQAEAYDRPLVEILPGFEPFMNRIGNTAREEMVHKRADGEEMVLGFKSVSFTDKDGFALGVIIDFQDLTQLIKMKSELARADRLAAIGELSARIAHEIRNPLAAISGSVQLIANGGSIDAADKRLLDIIVRETERLNKLIRDFLDYARPTQPSKKLVNLCGLVNEIRELMEGDCRFEGVVIRNDCPEELEVFVDADKFRQVLWNLMVNAVEAMSDEGMISINAEEISSSYELKGAGAVLVKISDTGSGMNEEELKRVFEPFHTTKTGGTGLGLATVYRVIEAHGGKIRVSSEKGKGTEFTIVLPAT